MWANPWGGGPWPIQQSAYQNMPHEQVDWASLAKQWIQQKEAAEVVVQDSHHGTLVQLQAPPPPPPPPPDPESSQESHGPVQEDENSMDISDGEGEVAPKPGTNGYNHSGPLLPTPGGNQGGDWGGSWAPNPPGPGDWQDNSQEGFAFGQGNSFGGGFPPPGDGFGFPPYWQPQGPGGPPGIGTDGFPPAPVAPFPPAMGGRRGDRHGGRGPHFHGDQFQHRMEDPGLDAAKRKQLPAWIRDGLEKMEREKQRQAEKEKMEHDRRLEAMEARERAEFATAEEDNPTGEARVPRKSRFDSDDDEDEDERESSQLESPAPRKKSPSPEVKKCSQSPKQFMTEEEKEANLLEKTKRLLTEVLLEVTSEEMLKISYNVIERARMRAMRAPAKVLTKSSALASITSLGLGYGSDSDEDESDEDLSSSDEAVRKPLSTDKKSEKIFSDEDSDYKPDEEPDSPEYLKVPSSEYKKKNH